MSYMIQLGAMMGIEAPHQESCQEMRSKKESPRPGFRISQRGGAEINASRTGWACPALVVCPWCETGAGQAQPVRDAQIPAKKSKNLRYCNTESEVRCPKSEVQTLRAGDDRRSSDKNRRPTPRATHFPASAIAE